MDGTSRRSLLVVGRLLKVTGNGRREKVADELRVFSRNGFSIDIVTIDDASDAVFERFQKELSGVVSNWFIRKDPSLTLIRWIIAGLALLRGRSDISRAISKPQRPKIAPGSLLNLFFSLPDPNVGWSLSQRFFLNKLVKRNGYTHLYSLSSPHSVHLACLYVKKRNPGVHWTISFRDPWSNYPLQHPGEMITRRNQEWERRCLVACDLAIIYKGWTPDGVDYYKSTFGSQIAEKVVEAPYVGGNERLMDRAAGDTCPDDRAQRDYLQLTHLGTLYGNDHTPLPLLEALCGLFEEKPDFQGIRVLFLGAITADVQSYIACHPSLQAIVSVIDYLPQEQAMSQLVQADVALWFQARESHFADNIPAKVFEYVYLGLPILAISRSMEQEHVLELLLSQQLITVGAQDIKGLATVLNGLMEQKKASGVQRYSSRDVFSRTRFTEWFESQVKRTLEHEVI